MVAGSQAQKLPASLAYPLIAVSILLLLVAVINLGHWFDGMFMTCISIIVGVCEIVAGVRVLLWLKRNWAKNPT
jgi:hypothetical protein